MKIIVDCFGGDMPEEVIKGALNSLVDSEIQLVLSGKEDLIKKIISNREYDKSRVEFLDAASVINNEDIPTEAIRIKKDSSLVVALKRLKDDDLCVGLVSAGSTGAVLTGATILVGRIRGVVRSALAPILPTVKGGHVLLVDCGANADCKPQMLLQFAKMGNAYARSVMGASSPRIALLSNGVEDKKGNELVHEVFLLMKQEKFNFVGNMEAREMLSGEYDVIVADGFSGNIALKSCEGAVVSLLNILKSNIEKGGLRAKLGYLLLKNVFRKVKNTLDYSNSGGAILLGIAKPIIKSHGGSKAKSIEASILQVKQMVEAGVIENITKELTIVEN